MDPATLVSIGSTGVSVGGAFFGQNPPSSQTKIQGKILEPSRTRSAGLGLPVPLLALGGIAVLFLIMR